MSAADVVAQCKSSGVLLALHEDRLSYEGPDAALAELLPLVKMHKAEIIVLLKATNDPPAMPADLAGKVREWFTTTCTRLGIDPAPVMRQFDGWQYPERDLREMAGWPDATIEAHCRLLVRERGEGHRPHSERAE
ncbi:MAG TPA: hypothetical protein VFQ88_05690 [Nevskiaceae bacterium]|nr:hypothetical protein [Nevskiaceae bacterium]